MLMDFKSLSDVSVIGSAIMTVQISSIFMSDPSVIEFKDYQEICVDYFRTRTTY